MANKSLLRCEIDIDEKEHIINKLLRDKPNYTFINSNLINSLNDFLPKIAQANKDLENQELLQQKRIDDNNILQTRTNNHMFKQYPLLKKHLKRTGQRKYRNSKFINLDLYLGVFDLKQEDQQNSNHNKKNFIEEV